MLRPAVVSPAAYRAPSMVCLGQHQRIHWSVGCDPVRDLLPAKPLSLLPQLEPVERRVEVSLHLTHRR